MVTTEAANHTIRHNEKVIITVCVYLILWLLLASALPIRYYGSIPEYTAVIRGPVLPPP